MSLFSCNTDDIFGRTKPVCIYAGVSPCRDQVSQFICNAHARFHGLIYKMANYTNGDNDSWSHINTYVYTTSNLNIPLFKSPTDNITLLAEVHNFTMNVCQTFPGLVRRELLADKISCLLGMNAVTDSCRVGGWLDDSDSSYLYIRDGDGALRRFTQVPRLHKILFYYTKPSTTVEGTTQLYLTDNVLLSWQPSTNSYSFTLIGKKLMLKYTDNDYSIATPIVLAGKRVVSSAPSLRQYRPINTSYNFC